MNQFAPLTEYLRRRLKQTSFEDVERFKQLLLLERLALSPLRDWRGEVVFLGLRALFPLEAYILKREAICDSAADRVANSPCLDWQQFATEPSEGQRLQLWQERIAWFEAGGGLQPQLTRWIGEPRKSPSSYVRRKGPLVVEGD